MKPIYITAISISYAATIILGTTQLQANTFNRNQNITLSQRHILDKRFINKKINHKSVSPEVADKLQTALDKTIEKDGVGASVKIINPLGKWVTTSGVSNLETQTPIQAEDKFQIGSITKTFTAVVVLKLAEEGKLSLDDTLEKWLPEIAQNIPDGNNITIRQLLNGSSGIYDVIENINTPLYQEILKNPRREWKPEELIVYADGKERQEWAYPNTGFFIAGMIIEKATNSTIATEIRRLISEPLGLTNTFFYTEEIPGKLVKGYIDIPPGDGKLDDVSFVNISFTGAAGGLISNPEDVTKFFQALLGGKLLKRHSFKEMFTFIDTKETNINRRYGLGIQLVEAETSELGKFTFIGHGGTIPSGFGAGMWVYPEFGVQLVYSENKQPGSNIPLTILETLSQFNSLEKT
ncbi:beta-lactamase family protein [Plectonema cf. radiosum LEGE 06105]|uniref:Beta-lactamase family protein n=1 Tax=Plectonema cf. radiosum LEGE 06105 TaxID=945769 RepID=A0A8J7K386_9CYAN|nr:serine hydrolase domain-containing protein [Plectonema radiosum]MBE9215596.1 beta-lactamase family protein [Plectonema cf. radiosum LEGE 06105]